MRTLVSMFGRSTLRRCRRPKLERLKLQHGNARSGSDQGRREEENSRGVVHLFQPLWPTSCVIFLVVFSIYKKRTKFLKRSEVMIVV